MHGAFTLGFEDDGFGRNAAPDQVIPADFAFGEYRVTARASGSEYAGRQVLFIQRESMIEPRTQYGRRLSSILRRPQDQNDIGRARLIYFGLPIDTSDNPNEIKHDEQRDESSAAPEQFTHVRYDFYVRI